MPDNGRVDFELLKNSADFRTVLTHYGLIAAGTGDQARLRCPFHDDTRPSCSVNFSKRVFHCFSCGAAGNVLDFVHRMENRDGAVVSLREAGLRLAQMCEISLEPKVTVRAPKACRATPNAGATVTSTNQAAGHALEGSDKRIDQKAQAAKVERNKPLSFQLTLDPEHPYLRGRVPPEFIEVFGLGYASRGLMAGRVCIPIHNADGELVAYAGRWAEAAELPEGQEKYKLPPGFHKQLELFNLHRVKESRHLVVVEGFFSAIRLYGLDVPAVALMGTALSEEQLTLLQKRCPNLKAVTVLLDGDAAGRTATLSIVPRLARHWWTRTAELPDGAQPDTIPHEVLARLLHLER